MSDDVKVLAAPLDKQERVRPEANGRRRDDRHVAPAIHVRHVRVAAEHHHRRRVPHQARHDLVGILQPHHRMAGHVHRSLGRMMTENDQRAITVLALRGRAVRAPAEQPGRASATA